MTNPEVVKSDIERPLTDEELAEYERVAAFMRPDAGGTYTNYDLDTFRLIATVRAERTELSRLRAIESAARNFALEFSGVPQEDLIDAVGVTNARVLELKYAALTAALLSPEGEPS